MTTQCDKPLPDLIFEAGIVGCGGAGFPTHVKLAGKAEYLIVNGVECEPLLATDRYLMRNQADAIVQAVCAAAEWTQVKHCVIALKRAYSEEIAALRKAMEHRGDAPIRLHLMDSFYPAGDEQTLVYEVTGHAVPPGGLPLDVGATVSNVGTMFAVSQAMEGKPFCRKYVTVTGEVASPVIADVPVGTSLKDCLALAGGVLSQDVLLVCGGPMMGRVVPLEDSETESVGKTTSGILVLRKGDYIGRKNAVDLRQIQRRAASVCTQCSFCTQLCPRYLLGSPLQPHKIMRTLARGGDLRELLHDPIVQSASLCCECGVCTAFACPMGLQPSTVNGYIRKELRAAGIRPERPASIGVHSEREYRKVPTSRLVSRIEVSGYLTRQPTGVISAEPASISISLSQGAGAPSLPAVSVGTRVAAGERIACCPEGSLGSNLHSGIAGIVTEIGESIVIEKEGDA